MREPKLFSHCGSFLLLLISAVVYLVGVAPLPVHAQATGAFATTPPEKPAPPENTVEVDAARFLFTEGNQLTDRRKHERALEALSLSYRLYPAPNTAVNIVGLLIDTGNYSSASAWIAYSEKLPGLRDSGRELLREFAQEIEAKQGQVQLILPAAPTKGDAPYEVRLEDRLIPMTEAERGIALDPGRYYLEVQQQGMILFATNVQLRTGQVARIKVRQNVVKKRRPAIAPRPFAPPTAEQVEEEPPPAEEVLAEVAPVEKDSSVDAVIDEPWFRTLVAVAAVMTVASVSLGIHEISHD